VRCSRRDTVVDRAIAAAKVAAIRDAVDRIRRTLPQDPRVFEADRTTREVVILNLFVALQETVSLATHWLADAGLDVPGSYREIFLALAGRGMVRRELAERLAAAAGFRNLVAHQYGVLDPLRVHAMAASELGDLLDFCDVVSRGVATD
jgi:uncharacterized protein YutE (UPF0331/DUF86 family)